MTEETIAVLALDAMDYKLVERFGCENLKLDNCGEIQTFSHSLELPYTPEVWTTVATGLDPEIHGIGDSTLEWENPILRLGGKITQYLPHKTRRKLGTIVAGSRSNKTEKMSFKTTNKPHIFDDGLVKGWPGITPANNLSQTWRDIGSLDEGAITRNEFEERLIARTGGEFGWIENTVKRTQAPVAGIHSHILDAVGHAYCDSERGLERMYCMVDEMVSQLDIDNLIILSDHGMQVEILGDENPGKHSWRAMISSTIDTTLPNDMYEVSRWVEKQKPKKTKSDTAIGVDTSTQHLKDLGYIE